MSRLIQKTTDIELNRRDFLKNSAAAAGAMAVMSLLGSSQSALAETEPAADAAEMSMEHSPIVDPEEGGEEPAE